MNKVCKYLIFGICMVFGTLRSGDFEGFALLRSTIPAELIALKKFVCDSFDPVDHDLLSRPRKKIFKRLSEIMRAGSFEYEGKREHIVAPLIYCCLQDAHKNIDIEHARLYEAISQFISRFEWVCSLSRVISIEDGKKVFAAVYLFARIIMDGYSDDQRYELLRTLMSAVYSWVKPA